MVAPVTILFLMDVTTVTEARAICGLLWGTSLDTDHWFDRLENDFSSLKTADTALVFDAHTNDSSQSSFATAFDVIRSFNEEALAQNSAVLPDSFKDEPPLARGSSYIQNPTSTLPLHHVASHRMVGQFGNRPKPTDLID